MSLPHVTALIYAAGLMDLTHFTEAARDRGSAVHKACQFADEGDLDESTVDPRVRPRLEGYRSFIAETAPAIHAIEEPVRNLAYGYVGTLDRRLTLNGREGVLDIKNGVPAPWHPLQLAFYAGCFDRPLRRWGLYLDGEGHYRLIEYTDRRDWEVCKAVLTLHAWRGEHAAA